MKKRKCRGKRRAEENGILPDVTGSASDRVVSLMDIEEGKPAIETDGAKIKRCPIDGFVGSARRPLNVSPRLKLDQLSLVKRDSKDYDKMCSICMAQPACRLSGGCDICSTYCKLVPTSSNGLPTFKDDQVVGSSRRAIEFHIDFNKTLFPVRSYGQGETKDIICNIIGIPNSSDIETLTILVTTYSNRPPPNELEPESWTKDKQTSPNNDDNDDVTQMKARFNDQDFDENGSNIRRIKEKENPDLIEGPPPFFRSSTNKVIKPKIQIPLKNLRRVHIKEDKIVGTPNEDIIVQPKESESDETDDDELEKTSEVTPIQTHQPDAKPPSILGRLKELRASSADKIPLAVKSNNRLSDISKTLQEVKTMVQGIQDEAKKDSDKRLLGSSLPANIPDLREKVTNGIPQSPLDSLQSAVPPQVVDNLKKINKYMVNRAQDALDTINHPDDQQIQQTLKLDDVEEQDHSGITKKLIKDLKIMPQYLLDRVKDTLNTFEGKPKIESNSEDVGASNFNKEVNLSNRLRQGDSDIIEDNDITTQNEANNNMDSNINSLNGNFENSSGQPEQVDVILETTTTKTYKSKFDKYLADMKERRQQMYSPEKFVKSSSIKTDKFPNLASRAKQNDELTPAVGSPIVSKKDLDKPVSKPSENLLQKRIELREKLNKYIEEVKAKALTPKETTSKTTNSEIEPQESNFNLPVLGDKNKESPNEQILGKPKEIDDVLSAVPKKSITEKPNRLMKYIQDIKAKRPVISTMKPGLSAIGKNTLENSQEPEKILLKDKIKEYVDNFKKQSTSKPPIFESRSDNNVKGEGQNLIDPSSPVSQKDILKEKIESYIDSIKNKPLVSRMSIPAEKRKFPELVRKSPEVPNERINSFKNKLEVMLKERMARPSKSDLRLSQANTDATEQELNHLTPPIGVSDIQEENVKTLSEVSQKLLDNQPLGSTQDTNLQSRAGFMDDSNSLDDWSNNLGRIVQSSSKPKDIFFMSNGIKLPLEIKHGKDGAMDLSVDLDKLCSCYNASCARNHAAIEETVGAILEKEAELKDQLKDIREEVVKSELPSDKPLLLDHAPKATKYKKTKRSSETTELDKNKVVTKLPAFQSVVTDLTDLGNQFHKTFTNTIGKIQDDVQEKNEKIKESLNGLQDGEHNNHLESKNSHNKFPRTRTNEIDDYIKNLEREKTLRKLLMQLNFQQQPDDELLKYIENQANAVMQPLDALLKKASKMTTENPFTLAEELKKNLKHALPVLPTLQNQVAKINENLSKVSDAYQTSKMSLLEKKLKELDKEVKEYKENNEKLLVKGSENLFGGHKNKVIEDEVNIIGKVLSWFGRLPKSDDNKK